LFLKILKVKWFILPDVTTNSSNKSFPHAQCHCKHSGLVEISVDENGRTSVQLSADGVHTAKWK